MDRRDLLRAGICGPAAFLSARMLWALPDESPPDWCGWGPLQKSNQYDMRLPAGFTARVVARSDKPPIKGEKFKWHRAPDGGACFATEDEGWIYVSNSELGRARGGASALRFDRSGDLVDAYPILRNSNSNCAGGATPWNTWLSCEEPDRAPRRGVVWECDPYGRQEAVARTALGLFRHEAVAVDSDEGILYMTEDMGRGCLYRYIPSGQDAAGRYDLTSGDLQVACWTSEARDKLRWETVPDPSAAQVPTREQVEAAAHFSGGEGIAWHDGKVFFTTKNDNRLWRYDTASQSIDIMYDDAHFSSPVLRGVDNVTITCTGDVLVAEDGDNMQLVAVNSRGEVQPLVQMIGHELSEMAGPAFNPQYTRLYFSSQWGRTGSRHGSGGTTYEVTGPFRRS